MREWISHIAAGVTVAARAIKLSFGLYLLTLICGLVLVWPVRSFLLQHAAHSSLLDDLLEGVAYTFLNDLRVAYGDGWLPNFGQLLIMAVLYLLVWTFLTGGIIQRLRTAKDPINFWAACGQHFRSLLAINGVFILLQFVLLLMSFLLYRTVSSGFSPARLDTETIIFTSLPWVGGVYLLLASWLVIWQCLSQIVRVREGRLPWYRAMPRGMNAFSQRFGSYASFGLLAMGVLLGAYLLFHGIKQSLPFKLWLFFLLTQGWLWVRIFLKLCFVAILLRFSAEAEA